MYNTLIDFIKGQYWARGYTEVVTPNVYNSKLWETSGHWQHYAENMFQFDVEGQTFALKPMNCPGHCVMFAAELRSYRDLPMRYADFGTLHRSVNVVVVVVVVVVASHGIGRQSQVDCQVDSLSLVLPYSSSLLPPPPPSSVLSLLETTHLSIQ